VPPAARRAATARGESAPSDVSDSCTIRISNLADDIVEADVVELCAPFARYGNPKVRLPRDSKSNRSRGFARVTFSTREEAEHAMSKIEGHPYNNVILHVDWAKDHQRP
jgi:translation initiation factor 3 subunit G